MQTGTRYLDVMDPTRVLVPAGDGTTRVYFDGRYFGKANLPASLFCETLDTRVNPAAGYGFVNAACFSVDRHEDPSHYDDEYDDGR